MVIFDMDGTLWDTVDVSYEAVSNICNKYEILKPISKETVRSGMGLSRKENAHNFMPYLDEEQGIYFMGLINDEVMKIINIKGASIYKGVIDTIKELSKNYKIGIITNNNDNYVKLFLKFSNLEKYITGFIGASTYGISKAEAIKKMCSKYNEPNSYYVGDIKKDMDSTIEAGQTFIHARYGFEPELSSKYYIDNISDLIELLKRIP